MGLFAELRRRNVFRVTAAYLVFAWLLLQVLDVVGPILGLPEAIARYLLFLLVVGIVPVVVVAWAFELTPEGLRREDGPHRAGVTMPRGRHRLDRVIMVGLALAVGVLLFDRFALRDDSGDAGPAAETAARAPGPATPPLAPATQKSVAALPFVAMSNGPDDDYFADGLTEEIINALTQLPDLLVTARTSAFHFKDRNLPVADIAQQLGVAHVLEGSVRRAGERLRVTAQLIRADDGFNLWSETYDRQTADSFAVQADIAEKVAHALNIYLDDALRERMHWVGTRDVEAFIAFQKGIEYYERAHREPNQISLLRQANIHFEQAIGRSPELVDAYQYHSDLYSHILLTRAAGELDGEITEDDIAQAPAALLQDYQRAARHARSAGQRGNAEFDQSLMFGHWRGLDRLGHQNVALPGCDPALWLQLVAPLSSDPQAILDAFRRMAVCDPLRMRPMVHSVGILVWLGRIDEAVDMARQSLSMADHPSLSRHLALGLALRGDTDEAVAMANSVIREEDELLRVRAMLSAVRGDAAAAKRYQVDFLGKYGPNDRETLIMEAAQGNRGEANRLAAAIDARPFGHVVLLQAIYDCLCGAPFDLGAAPEFAGLLVESGLDWPPPRRGAFPLKDW